MEKILAELSKEGIKAGAIKRSHHKVEFDKPGKDSYRFNEAGANPVALVGDGFFAYMERGEGPSGLKDVACMFAGKVDIVLVEGFTREDVPRLCFMEMKGQDGHGDTLTKAYITDGEDTSPVDGKPVFSRDDAPGLARWIIDGLRKGEWRQGRR